jgi:hypothetical protein
VAISYVGGASNVNLNAGSVTVTLPGGMAANDLILLAWSCGDDDFTQPTLAMTTGGYTELTTSTLSVDGGAGGDGNLAVFYKYHNGSDTTAVTAASGTGTDSSNAVAVLVFRGVALAVDGGPLEVAIATATGTTAGDPNPPSVSGFDEATAVVVIAGATTDVGATPTLTAPANYTTNAVLAAHTTETNRAGIGLAYREDPGDPEDPGAFTSGGDAWAAATMVLRAAAEPKAIAFPRRDRRHVPMLDLDRYAVDGWLA